MPYSVQSKVHRSFTLIARVGSANDRVKEWGVYSAGECGCKAFRRFTLSDRAGDFRGSAACIGLSTLQRGQEAKPTVRQRLAGALLRYTFDFSCQKANEWRLRWPRSGRHRSLRSQ
jgi:hypothetical protein